jgi:glycosyltransferase involved in cell wall biosynthesis
MKFLIVEPQCDGHYMVLYIKFIIRALSKKKCQLIILTSKKATEHIAFQIITKENKNIKVEYLDYFEPKNKSTISLIFYQIKLFFSIKKKFRELNKIYNFDHVFINSLDHFDKAMSVFGDPFEKTLFSGIFVNPKFHFTNFNLGNAGRYNMLSLILFKRLLSFSNLKKIFSNDIFFINYTKNFDFNYKVEFLQEPREFSHYFTKSDAQKKLFLPQKLIYLLVYGALKKSKGITELINAFVQEKINPKIRIILAGKQDKEISDFIKLDYINDLINKKKIFIFNKFQSDEEESLLFCAASIVWVGYQKNFPFLSGVLYQAAIKKLPIIASNQGIIGWMNKKYKLGYSIDIDNPKNIIDKLNKISKNFFYNSFDYNINFFAKKANPKFFMEQLQTILNK